MKVLVTGAAGFIGWHTCDALAAEGFEVVGIDNFTTGSRDRLSVINLDCRNGIWISSLMMETRPDAVIHLAAQVAVGVSTDRPAFDAVNNIVGTINVLEAAAAAGVRRFVFASSGGCIYGEHDGAVASESTPLRPISHYGIGKAAGEMYVGRYADRMSTVCMRYANVYGPRQNPHGESGVVAIFIGNAIAGKASTIYGDGGDVRDYVYATDVAAANVLAVRSDITGPVNIGTGFGTTVNKVDAAIRSVIQGPAPLYAPERPGVVRRNVLDITRAAWEMGWLPRVEFDEGIDLTIRSQQ